MIFPRILLVAFCIHLGTSSLAVQSSEHWPEHWLEVGAVQEWMDLDAVFYRSSERRSWDGEHKVVADQQSLYRRTFRYDAALPAVDLAAWLELSPQDQARRIDLAADKLKIVVRFLNRMRGWACDIQSSGISGWGRKNSVDVLPQCMESLNTAVQLDPANPLTWHLLGYFSTCVGDMKRAQGAFAGAEEALALLPDDALPEVRRRLALDRVWLHRDLGAVDRARTHLRAAEEIGGKDLESTLLKGLIAVQAGDEAEARRLAGELRSVKIPRSSGYSNRNPDHWVKKASDFAKSWIMALVWIDIGHLEMAQLSFKQFSFQDRYPFAHRFWNDAGGIYMRTGRQDAAPAAWYLAHRWIPYRPFFMHRRYGWENQALTGINGVTLDYAGFNQFYLAGDRLSFACRYATAMETAGSDEERMLLGVTAIRQLEICRRTGFLPGHALLVEALVHYFLGDLDVARPTLQEGKKWLRERGYKLPRATSNTEVEIIRSTVMKPGAFRAPNSGRPGTMLSREDLESAWQKAPTDENRRALGIFLIRNGDPEQGRGLILNGAPSVSEAAAAGRITNEDLCLVLEADRVLGDLDTAQFYIGELVRGNDQLPGDTQVWALVGFISIDHGDLAGGRLALEKASALEEVNPMLGNRGVRLGITQPWIYDMQVKAIVTAACELKLEGVDVRPEIMVPLVGDARELSYVRERAQSVAASVMSEKKVHVDCLIGTMIEIPRACVTADEVAKVAEFSSFGTNDLTQMTYGFSRDDAGPVIRRYIDVGIIRRDPFEALDQTGVGGLMKYGVSKARKVRPDIKLGICGEHGGEPSSIMFCEEIGLDYVSCSPFRIPVARLAAARAVLLKARVDVPSHTG